MRSKRTPCDSISVGSVVVTFEPWSEMRPGIEAALDGLAEVTYLAGLD
jgi:hypothetical protein